MIVNGLPKSETGKGRPGLEDDSKAFDPDLFLGNDRN
jgi:hypothetical protein